MKHIICFYRLDHMRFRRYIGIFTVIAAAMCLNAGYLEYRSDIPQDVIAYTDCQITNTAFKGGEKITYIAYYNWQFVWLSAGEATFTLLDKGDYFDLKVYGKTYEGYDAFFRVRDYFHSVIDKKTMLPKSFVRIVEEGNYRKFDSLSFNHKNLSAISYNGPSRAKAKRKYITIHACTHDLLSVLYYMRNININAYKPGEYIPTKLLFDENIYAIKVRYEGKKANHSIKDVGTYNTVHVIPDLVTGTVFKDGNKMHVWVSDDANKLPLYIESPLAVGSAKAVLKSYSGLRHAQSAKKK
jgi:hypothetical protein